MSHYKPYPVYKDSGVEWLRAVPEHWEVKRLRHVAALNPSPNWDTLERQQSEYPFLPMEAISEAGEFDASRQKSLAESRRGYSYFAEGDVVYAKVTPCFENGKGAVIRGLESGHGFGTTELTVLRPNGIDRDFLYALTYAGCFRQQGASEMLGSGGLKRVPDEFARNFKVAFPPFAEQTVIAAALGRETRRIDALIAKKTRFIELLKEKRQSLITHAVTKGLDPKARMRDSAVEWIGEVPAHWRAGRLKHVLAAPLQYGANESGEKNADEDIRYIRITDLDDMGALRNESVKRLPLQTAAPYLLKDGDILFARSGATVGKTYRHTDANGPACFAGYLIRGRPDTTVILSQFVTHAVRSHYYWAYIQHTTIQATIENVSAEKYGDFPLAIPPIAEQKELVAYVDKATSRIDELVRKSLVSITLLTERRSALITAAVTGQIDLRQPKT